MRPQAYEMLAARQATYWWHRARRSMSVALLRRGGLKRGCRWLDLGCGPGGNLAMLDALKPDLIAAVDLSPIALNFARKNAPAADLVRADITKGLPFGNAAFDVVTIYNVLYHRWIACEGDVLREVFRVLRPGGLLLLTEPALPILEREMDALAMGQRRYRLGEIAALCRVARLDVVFSSYFTSFGVPALLAMKLAKRLLKRKELTDTEEAADMKPLPPISNEAMYQLACLEGRLIVAGLRIPFGVTLISVARRSVEEYL